MTPKGVSPINATEGVPDFTGAPTEGKRIRAGGIHALGQPNGKTLDDLPMPSTNPDSD